MFTGNALIGLREGLEAGLVITVLATFLAGRGRRRDIRFVYWGVAVAVLASIAAGTLLASTAANLDGRRHALFETAASVLAVAMVTATICWMRNSLQHDHRRLERQLSRAIRLGPLAVFTVALVSVLREGMEAAVFVLVLADGGGTGAVESLAGLLAGVAAAAALTWLLHAGLVRFDPARFLTATGLLLIVIAAGILASSVAHLQQVRLLPGSAAIAFDLSAAMPMDGWTGHLVSGLLGLSARPTVLALAVWACYAGTALTMFLVALARPAQHAEPARRARPAQRARSAQSADGDGVTGGAAGATIPIWSNTSR